VANDAGSGPVALGKQTNTCKIVHTGAATMTWQINASSFKDGAGVTRAVPLLALQQVLPMTGSGNAGELGVDLTALSALSSAVRNIILGLFITGGEGTLGIASDGLDVPLVVELRALRTADYVANGAVVEPVLASGVTGPNLALPPWDTVEHYGVEIAPQFPPAYGEYDETAVAISTSAFTLPAAPPSNVGPDVVFRITRIGSWINRSDVPVHVTAK
jgi:hypothetical protein